MPLRTGSKNIEKWGQHFERLVLGCIDADLYNQILILQHFPRSTRFANRCTAPNSKFQQEIVHIFCKLKYRTFRNYMKFFDVPSILPLFMVMLMKICRNLATNSRKWKVLVTTKLPSSDVFSKWVSKWKMVERRLKTLRGLFHPLPAEVWSML